MGFSGVFASGIRPAHRYLNLCGPIRAPDRSERRGKAGETSTRATKVDLETLCEEASHCRACPLYKDATQTMFGKTTPINKNHGRSISTTV